MAQYFATINSTDNYQLFSWDANSFRGSQQLHFATDDLSSVKTSLENLATISITDGEGNEVANFSEFDGYSSINYLGRNYSPQLNGFANELVAVLTKVDIVLQVQRLDAQVNKIINIESMSLEEYKEYKVSQFSELGQAQIFEGTTVELGDGNSYQFTYNFEDQCNLLNALFTIQALGDLTISLPYHSHGEPCELFSALDIMRIYFGLQFFSTQVQTHVNMLNAWVRSCATKEEAEAITFTSELPAEYVAQAEAIIGPTLLLAQQLQAYYFPETSEGTEDEGTGTTE